MFKCIEQTSNGAPAMLHWGDSDTCTGEPLRNDFAGCYSRDYIYGVQKQCGVGEDVSDDGRPKFYKFACSFERVNPWLREAEKEESDELSVNAADINISVILMLIAIVCIIGVIFGYL